VKGAAACLQGVCSSFKQVRTDPYPWGRCVPGTAATGLSLNDSAAHGHLLSTSVSMCRAPTMYQILEEQEGIRPNAYAYDLSQAPERCCLWCCPSIQIENLCAVSRQKDPSWSSCPRHGGTVLPTSPNCSTGGHLHFGTSLVGAVGKSEACLRSPP
jgi:hypothetical protein